jgi:polyhydroxyalkanoate synthesis regulator phasin
LSDLISRALLVGLGLASLSKDAIEKTAEDFIKQSKISEEEGKRLVKDLHKRAAQVQRSVDRKVEKAVNQALKGLNVAVVKLSPGTAKPSAKSAAHRSKKTATHATSKGARKAVKGKA